MLTQHLICKRKLPRCMSVVTHLNNYFYSTKSEIDTHVEETPEFRLSEPKRKIRQRSPFVKNFFRGVYDTEFAAFPEPQTHERHGEFFNWLKPIEDYIETNVNAAEIDSKRKIPLRVIEDLRHFGVFRAPVPTQYNGLGLNNSEFTKLIETVSRIPALGVYVANQAVPITLLLNFGTDAQKAKYLPKIASSEYIPTVCISEDMENVKDGLQSAQATKSNDDKSWILSGTKTNVLNADKANLFIVFAEGLATGALAGDVTSGFIVERSSDGIIVEPPINTLGCRGLSLCNVIFNKTTFPSENSLQYISPDSNVLTSIFSIGKHNIGAQAIGITKQYLRLLIDHMKKDKNFNAIKFQNDHVQEIIGKICCSIYGMESILYLTTGMMDTVSNQDCDLEKCIVELYCVDACIESLIMGTNITGLLTQLEGIGLERLIRDGIFLKSIDGLRSNLESTIALMGIQHFASDSSDYIEKSRDPWSNPSVFFKNVFSTNSDKKLFIAENLHPSLKEIAECIEYSLNEFKQIIMKIAVKYGCNISERHTDLKRISEVASLLYVMSAVVARSSRSYCLGMRDSEKELYIAQILSYGLYRKTEELLKDMLSGIRVNGDLLCKHLSDTAFEKNSYFLEHPLARNF